RLLVVPRLVSAARLHRRDDVHQAGVFATSFQHLRHDRFTFLCHAFELTPDGRLKYPELAFSGPKKSGKTAFAAMILLYVVRILGGRHAEGVCRGQRLRTGPRASFSGSCAHCRGVAAVTTTVARGPAHAASASGV